MIELKNTPRSTAALKKFTEACAAELDGGRPILIVLGDKTGVAAICDAGRRSGSRHLQTLSGTCA